MTTATPTTVYGAVKQISYTLISRTGGAPHEVKVNPFTRRPTSCTCPAQTKGRRACWAMKAVEAGVVNVKPHIRFGPMRNTTVSDLYA